MQTSTRWISLPLAVVLAGCVRAIIVDCDASPEAEVCRPDAERMDASTVDGSPVGPLCTIAQDCLRFAGQIDNCAQACVLAADGMRRCMPGTAPDGTYCGTGTDSVCVAGVCEVRRCGDGFVDRLLVPPEYCDDGNSDDSDLCTRACTRSCVPPVPPMCDDPPFGDPCAGREGTCDGSVCVAPTGEADETPCNIGGASGICLAGRCMTR